jgi:phosphatidylserine/phosphatidylglycerophosphate/cardiolipin synthase-like enzyme
MSFNNFCNCCQTYYEPYYNTSYEYFQLGNRLEPKLEPKRWKNILNDNLNPKTTVIRTGNDVKYLIDGKETFKEMVDAIRTANRSGHYIYLLGWINQDDFNMIRGENGTTFRELITKASSNGVQIRTMLWDHIGTTNSSQIKYINNLKNGAAILDNETLKLGCHHQKVLIVKGSEGLITFCGGIDINIDRIEKNRFGAPLHDVHCKITGPAAYDLLTTFRRRWYHHPMGSEIDIKKGILLGNNEVIPESLGKIKKSLSVCIARTFNPINNTTKFLKERDIKNLLITAIRNTKDHIYIEDQYLIHPEAAEEIRKVIPKIKNVTILIAGYITDLPCVTKLRTDFINIMTKGLSSENMKKVNVFILVSPPPFPKANFGEHTYVHSKTWIIDDELAIIGSANVNRRGWEYDSEVNAFIFDDNDTNLTFAKDLRKKLWREHLNIDINDRNDILDDSTKFSELWLKQTKNKDGKVMLFKQESSFFNFFTDPLCKLGSQYIIDPTKENYYNYI